MLRTPPKDTDSVPGDANWSMFPKQTEKCIYLPDTQVQENNTKHETSINLSSHSVNDVQSLYKIIEDLKFQLKEQEKRFLNEHKLLKQQLKKQPIKTQQQQQNSQNSPKKLEKRKRSSPGQVPALKQLKLKESWLNPTTTENLFNPLFTEDEEDVIETNKVDKVVKTVKPPPIYISGVAEINPLNETLKSVCKQTYSMKILNNHEVKLQTTGSEDYRSLVTELEEKGTEFHSYKPKHLRNFRVVIRGLHASTDPCDIKSELEQLQHNVTNVYNIKNRKDSRPLPLFYVDLLPHTSNKDIYNVKYLMHTKISVEAPHKKREIPQCSRCQTLGHTHKYCHRERRCVKCTGNHGTKDCPRSTRDNKVQCVLCSGNHPANFKGCPEYKKMQEKKFPTLRKKIIQVPENHRSEHNLTNITNFRQPNIAYAQVVSGNLNQKHNNQDESQQQQSEQHPSHNNQNRSNDINEMKNMMKDLMGQISPLINLLTIIVSKMN